METCHFPDHLSIFSKSQKSYVKKKKLFLTNGWVGSQFVIFIMAGRHSRPIRLLGENYQLYNYMYIMTSRRSVLAQALLHIPPPRLLPLSFVGKHAEIRTWHLHSPRSLAIINKIMSRLSVRYLILSNGKKSPPTYANAVFAAPVGRDTAGMPRRSELEKGSGRGERLMLSQ